MKKPLLTFLWALAATAALVAETATASTENFSTTNALPPPQGVYISPALWHVLYANGIIIRDVAHHRFTQGFLPPAVGATNTHGFGSQVDFEVSMDNGATFTPAAGGAGVQVRVEHTTDAGVTNIFDTEMLQLNLTSGGIMVRESPTLASMGQTTVRPVAGGYMISSFFDIFTEVSLDGGLNWSPALQPAHVELRNDPMLVTPVPEPTPLLPPPNGTYVSPEQWHALYAQGIVIKDVSHKIFTDSHPPPPPGGGVTHAFNSQLDMQVSTDSGQTYQFVRVATPVQVSVASQGSSSNTIYDTEMLMLDLSLPNGVMIRESPTEPSRGQTKIAAQGDGTFLISSFFDIFTELSLDSGQSWSPASNGPVRVQLVQQAPEVPAPDPNLPPPNGAYVSPEQWHALYASGIIITNAAHDKFTQTQPPPPPGGSQTENFGSQVRGQISMDGGASFQPFTAPANVAVQVSSSQDSGNTRFFDTEMLSLNLAGGTLPGGMMVRESPSKASLGRTSVRLVPSDGTYQVSSFFDVFTELSLDGGQNWSPMVSAPGTMTLQTATALSVTCSGDITVMATGPAGAVVTYISSASGGCAPVNVVCNPPSGTTFPIGTTTVTCVGTDACGNTATCSFTVTVRPPKEVWQPNPLLPPQQGEYISPERWHQLYANGIVISNVSHQKFLQSFPLPPANGTSTHSFGSTVQLEVSQGAGLPFTPVTAPANVSVRVTHTGTDPDGTRHFDTEMLQLDISGGGLPPTMMIRESPTRASTGRTTVRPTGDGFMIGSFFDVFTELSTDGGAQWSPAQDAAYVELGTDPRAIPPIAAPSSLLPAPNGQYVSPQDWHALYAQGIVIKDVSHKFFTDSHPPPATGAPETHTFGSQLDMQLSTDAGATFQQVRAEADVTVSIRHRSTADDGTQVYDTEMLSLTLTGPGGIMIRESPTRQSLGGTAIAPSGRPPGDPDFDLLRIGSFFDIFTEVSTDGGTTWEPSTNGPVRVELEQKSHEIPVTTPNLPPADSAYISPADWHALYANGIIISNASHDRFTQSQPPPPPGGSQTHSFGSTVQFDVIGLPGQPPQRVTAPANVTVRVTSSTDSGNTRFFETEMLALDISGGGLPSAVMVRESPTRASLGRTSIRSVLSDGTFRIDSFFDIFTEISLDNGQSWSPAVTGPGTVAIVPPLPIAPFGIVCPSDIIVVATSPAGAEVSYVVLTSAGDCPFGPVTVTCIPPSGSTFPVGTTTVTCTGNNGCGEHPTCTFKVTVLPQFGAPDYFFRTNTLPPTNSVYISPAQWHALYANGIIIRDVKHRRFTQSLPPPPPGGSQTHSFGSEVAFEVSTDSGDTFQSTIGTANVTVRVTRGPDQGGTATYDTEMLQLDLTGGGGGAGGMMLRESPTRASTGRTTVRPVAGGHMISSFFDIFTEVSLDGGQNWSPAQQSAHVELRPDPNQVPQVEEPTSLLPPPTDNYVSPEQWHALYAQGIVIKDVSHKFFTDSQPPPPAGESATHTFGSQLDMQVSTDGGQTFQPVRASADVEVRVSHASGNDQGTQTFDTEMLSLNLSVPGTTVMIRESPTLPSRGGTSIARSGLPPGDPDFDLLRIGSFFDIFTELSMDGGQTWEPATNGPVRVQLEPVATEQPAPSENLPPANGEYISPDQWHALYAQGIIISNVSHAKFLQNSPPPPPGDSRQHTFGSTVEVDVVLVPGQPPTHVLAPAEVVVRVDSSDTIETATGATRYFDTEMLQLSLQGGGLPANIRLRESPTRASLGRTSVRSLPSGQFMVDSFFDIFTELSMDGGTSWEPNTNGPVSMRLRALPPAEANKPKAVILTPKSGWETNKNSIAVAGTASDDVRVEAVVARVNGGSWQSASVTRPRTNRATWTLPLTLSAGTNVVDAKAVDSSGNESLLATAKYFMRVESTLTLTTNGSGSLSVMPAPPYFVGRRYSLAAVPSPNNLLSNVIGQTASGSSLLYAATPEMTAQKGATVGFLMQSNLALVGNFISNRFSDAAGTYYGLFSDPAGVAHQSGGFITFKTDRKLNFSGKVHLEGEKVSFAGTFDLAGVGKLKKPAVRKGMANEPIHIVPVLDLSGSNLITGTVSNGAWSAGIDADRQLAFTSNSWTWGLTGRQYTMVLPGSANAAVEPGGDGYSLITIGASPAGTVWIGAGGYFGDGEKGKPVKVPPSQAGRWPFYAALYKTLRTTTAPPGPAVTTYRGSVQGWLQFTNGTVQGDLDWRKVGWTNGIYDGGFSNRIPVAGSPYIPPVPLSGVHVISITNGLATVADGNLGGPVTTEFDWTDLNKLVFAKPLTIGNPNGLALTVNYKNGEVKGSFLLNPSDTLSRRSLYGAVLQNLNLGYGNFKGTNESGSILLQEQP